MYKPRSTIEVYDVDAMGKDGRPAENSWNDRRRNEV